MRNFYRPVLFSWIVLIAATLGSWYIGLEEVGEHSPYVPWFSTGLIVLATFKIRLIGLYFMELRHAPWSLRGIFELWVLCLSVGALGFYHFSPTA